MQLILKLENDSEFGLYVIRWVMGKPLYLVALLIGLADKVNVESHGAPRECEDIGSMRLHVFLNLLPFHIRLQRATPTTW